MGGCTCWTGRSYKEELGRVLREEHQNDFWVSRSRLQMGNRDMLTGVLKIRYNSLSSISE